MPFLNFLKLKRKEKLNPFTIREGNFRRLDTSYRYQWTEDSFISGQLRETIGRVFNFSRTPFILLAVFSFLALLLFRIAWLQIAQGEYYRSLAEGNRIRLVRLEAKRGIIYDRRLSPLARNAANFILYLTPADLPPEPENKKEIISRLGQILPDLNQEELAAKLEKIKRGSLESFQPFPLADNISYEKAMLLYLEADSLPAVNLISSNRREYNLPSLSFSHVLGYTGKISEEELEKLGADYLPIDYVGKTGVEYFLENELRGVNGRKQVEVDALGKEKKVVSQEKGEDGKNLVLSLDSALQKKAEEVLTKKLAELKLGRGAVIALDPRNGEVLALVSLPAYDNNIFVRGATIQEYNSLLAQPDKPLFNRAVSGEYPSGSIIKPVVAAAALEEGIINEQTSFLSSGGIRIDKWFFPDWLAGGHGKTDVRRALAESINTFFYYVGGGYEDFQGLGVERIVRYARLFGLGEQTGLDLAGESAGFLPTPAWKEETKGERWYIGDTYHLAIGQGDILVTPLQAAMFTSVFANGGSLYRPHLWRGILNERGEVELNEETKAVRSDFIHAGNIEIVRQGMRQAVTAGSARALSSLPVAAAGKTGTAQWSSKNQPHAWFTGFAPYENPEIVITVLIEEGGEGSATAVPIAAEILAWYFGERE